MDEIKAKQQVVEKIKDSAKILVTVSDSPSVDALSAALALTMVLDKQEKYATSIFSGETPPAIAFLEPEKTFDDTTDSLRDFIIALNKEKADHLRYKVEGDSVKIFITPYKTTIDQSDLDFSQGDYNVELVIALGVDNQDHLDKALEDHGQILHDAAIITMTAGDQSSDLGGIDWHDSNSSSLSEMVAGLAEALKEDKKKPLIDEAIATALLTGIVAETDRFSNEHTTSKVMTVAASLMAAGADQQLIANELQAARNTPAAAEAEADASQDDDDVEIDTQSADGSLTITKHNDDPSSLEIAHDGETLAELDRRVLGDEKAKEKVIEEVEAAQEEAAGEDALEEAQQETAEVEAAHIDAAADKPLYVDDDTADDEPRFGGTLNATTEQAADDARREEEGDQNKTILSHAYLGGDAASPTSEHDAQGFPGTPSVAPGSIGVNDVPAAEGANDMLHSAYAPSDTQLTSVEDTDQPTIAVGAERVIQPLSDMPAAAPTSAYAAPEASAPEPSSAYAPVNPTPTDLGLPLPPPIPDFSQINASGPALPLPPTQQPAILGDILAPEPAPVDVTANAVPAPNTAYAPPEEPTLPPLAPSPEPQTPSQPGAPDPGQFQIPPQQ